MRHPHFANFNFVVLSHPPQHINLQLENRRTSSTPYLLLLILIHCLHALTLICLVPWRYSYIVHVFYFSSGNKFLCLLRGLPLPLAQIQVSLQLDPQRYAMFIFRRDLFIYFNFRSDRQLIYLNAFFLLGGRNKWPCPVKTKPSPVCARNNQYALTNTFSCSCGSILYCFPIHFHPNTFFLL